MSTHGRSVWLREHPRFLILLIVVLADILLFAAFLPRSRGVLTVAFLDVGQGDAVFVEAPNGNQLLYDAGGPSGAVLRALPEVMPHWDRSIDVVVLSHPDLDHVGGFPEVFARYYVSLTLESGAVSDNGAHAAAEEAIRAEGAAHFLARRGMVIDLGGGVTAEILYPDRDTTTMETNAASVVMRLRHGESSFLLSGDLPENIENYQVALYGKRLTSDVLKLGHHGSRTSSGEAWLRAVDPDIAVISAGRDNRYGHPHEEVLERLRRFNIPFAATFIGGTIVFKSDGTTIRHRNQIVDRYIKN